MQIGKNTADFCLNRWEIVAQYDKIAKENDQYFTETSVKM